MYDFDLLAVIYMTFSFSAVGSNGGDRGGRRRLPPPLNRLKSPTPTFSNPSQSQTKKKKKKISPFV
jgi:hypothetical protein